MCVQRFDDSLRSAIHITYRISLRSSSLREPRDPLSKVVSHCFSFGFSGKNKMVYVKGWRPIRRWGTREGAQNPTVRD